MISCPMKKKSAFTLVEVIIAIIIVGILAALGTVSYVRIKRSAEYKGALSIVQSLVAAAKNRYLSMGTYATTTCTTETNNVYGTKITDEKCTFHNYTVRSIAGPSFYVRLDYAGGEGAGAHTANYSFNKDGVRIGCTGTDCMP